MEISVSVITPNFNRAGTLPGTIESVLAQTCDNWEMILIDDCSTDESFSIISGYADRDNRIKAFKRHRIPKGPSTSRNIGAEKAVGKYLIFLDSDDLLAEYCLSQRVEMMRKSPDLDFAVFNIEVFSEKPGDTGAIFNQYPVQGDTCLNMFLRNDLPFQTMAPIWTRDSFLKFGGFDEELTIMEDPELHTRVLLQNPVFLMVKDSQPDCFYRQNSFNKEKETYFYDLSITGRISFIKKTTGLIHDSIRRDRKKLLRKLRFSLYKLFGTFMLGRLKAYKTEYDDILNWARTHKILTVFGYFKLRLFGTVFIHDNTIIRQLRIKGIMYKLFKICT